MMHIITMEELLNKTSSQKRKNNFFSLTTSEQLNKVIQILNGITTRFKYGDTCLIVHSSFQRTFNNSLKKDYLNQNIQSKEKIFEIKNNLEYNTEKNTIFNQLKLLFEINKNIIFFDIKIPLEELEYSYGISKHIKDEQITIYSSKELFFQIENCSVENHLKSFFNKKLFFETKIRLTLLGSFGIGISSCLPKYSFNDINYNVQFGDKTLSKIYNEIEFSKLTDENFIDTIFPVIYQFTLEKFIGKLEKDEVSQKDIDSEIEILELLIKHNIKNNLNLIDLNTNVDKYDIEIKSDLSKISENIIKDSLFRPSIKY